MKAILFAVAGSLCVALASATPAQSEETVEVIVAGAACPDVDGLEAINAVDPYVAVKDQTSARMKKWRNAVEQHNCQLLQLDERVIRLYREGRLTKISIGGEYYFTNSTNVVWNGR